MSKYKLKLLRGKIQVNGDLSNIETTYISGWSISTATFDKASFDLDIESVNNLCKQVKCEGTEDLRKWWVEENNKKKRVTKVLKGEYDLPPRINEYLKWYQKQAVKFFDVTKNCVIGYDMGLGKTLISIRCCQLINAKKILYVCPNYLKYSIQEEFQKWCDLSTIVIDGTVKQKQKQFSMYENELLNVMIINYEQIKIKLDGNGKVEKINVHNVIQDTEWDIMILDEAQRVKTRTSQTTTGIKAIAAKSRLMLTGTPIAKNPGEIWSLLSILDRKRFKSYWNFVEYYACKIEDFRGYKVGNLTKPKHYRHLLKYFMLRYLKEDVEDLPDKIFIELPVKMLPKQQKYYNIAKEEFLKPDDEVIASPVEQFIRLNQIAVNPSIVNGDDISIIKDTVLDMIDDIEGRCIIGCEYIAMTTNLTDSLQLKFKKGVKRQIYCINSTISIKNRQTIINNFKEDETAILVTSIRCLAEGVNLDCCDHMILANISWNCGTNKQFYNRIHRMTSTRQKNYYFIIVKDSILEYKYKKIEKERKYAEFALGDSDDTIIRKTMEDFKNEYR